MDQYYCRGLKGTKFLVLYIIKKNETKKKEDAFSGNVNEEALYRIDRSKQDHKKFLTEFRSELQGTFKREQHVRNELK